MIFGERIRFRAIEKPDLPLFVSWLNDPEVRHGLLLHSPLSQTEEDGWYERMLARPVDQHVMVIEVNLSSAGDGDQNWKPIGTCAFSQIDWRTRAAEFGIVIGDKSFWNQGYGTEAVRLLAHYGFNTLNLNRIYLHVFETNPRAIRAYEKAGFMLEGRERQAEYQDGAYIDVLRMSRLRED